jgi:hypothetical protein
MSDEPKTPWMERTPARVIGLRVLMGIGAGIAIALLNPPSWRFWLECVALGAIFGLVGGITSWLVHPTA